MSCFSHFISLFIIVSCLAKINYCEIHRVRGIKPKGLRHDHFAVDTASVRSTWPPGPQDPSEGPIQFDPAVKPEVSGSGHTETKTDSITNNETHTFTIWIYALVSAVLVGLSGIFPLLVIPIETGESLRHGASAARLKLLLSFAVGGLLGDVFLHLLPEAWAHVDAEDHHSGHTRIGLWVIAGLLSFLITEKVFPDDAEEEEEEDGVTSEKHSLYSEVKSEDKLQSSNEHCYKQNGDVHKTGNGCVANRHIRNGYVANSGAKAVQNSGVTKEASAAKKEHSTHIKTSGWLNLLANVVDNFTHGLAVAGSYCCGVKVGLLTTCAILLHEIPHEMGDFAILLRSGFDRWQAAKAQLLTATGGVLGAFTALTASSVEQAGKSTSWILPFTSGGFIYIALVTVVPDLLKEQNPRESFKQILLLLLGIFAMALVTMLSG